MLWGKEEEQYLRGSDGVRKEINSASKIMQLLKN